MNGHHLVNRSDETAHYVEIGSRMPDEEAIYSDIDMKVKKRAAGGSGVVVCLLETTKREDPNENLHGRAQPRGYQHGAAW
jgi:uncharacterized cupin superfamily protein